jgi:polygalacturonase
MLSRRSVIAASSALAGGGLSEALAQTTAARRPAARDALNVLDFGAVPDGRTVNTAAFARATKACSDSGAGIIHVPPGTYITGPVTFGSNTVLHLDAGAVVKGSPALADYTVEAAPISGASTRIGLVTVRDAENVAIVGRGIIDGNGMGFVITNRNNDGPDWDKKYTRQKDEYMDPKFGTESSGFAHGDRPGNLIRFINCRKALVEGVTIQNSPTWTMQFHRCQDVNVRGVNINSDASDRRIGNDDGMDLRDCENIRVSDCNIHTGDDCIAVFGSRNLAVANCVLSARSAGIRVGYSGGDTRNCVFQNLIIHTSNCGLKVNVRGGGVVEDVLFSDIVMRTGLITGHWWGKGEPANVSAVPGRANGELGHIRRIRFSNILAESENSFLLYGSPNSPIENVLIENLELRMRDSKLQASYGGNFDLRDAADLSHALFEHDVSGLFFRHVQGLRVRGMRLFWDESVPPFFAHGIEGEEFRDVDIQGFEGRGANGRAAIALRNGSAISIRECRATNGGAGAFVSQTGVSDQRLFVNNDLRGARRTFEESGPSGFAVSGNVLAEGER